MCARWVKGILQKKNTFTNRPLNCVRISSLCVFITIGLSWVHLKAELLDQPIRSASTYRSQLSSAYSISSIEPAAAHFAHIKYVNVCVCGVFVQSLLHASMVNLSVIYTTLANILIVNSLRPMSFAVTHNACIHLLWLPQMYII